MNYRLLFCLMLFSFNLSARVPHKLFQVMKTRAALFAKNHPSVVIGVIDSHLQELEQQKNKKLKKETCKNNRKTIINNYHAQLDYYQHEVLQQSQALYNRLFRDIYRQAEIEEQLFFIFPIFLNIHRKEKQKYFLQLLLTMNKTKQK